MPTLKQLINRYLYRISFLLVFLSLLVISVIQLKIEHEHAYTEGIRSLTQIEQIMSENQQELSHTFSLFRVNPNVSYFAIDSHSGQIVGSSQDNSIHLNCSEIGFSFADIQNGEEEGYANINKRESYCVFKKIDSTYVAYVIPLRYLYREVPIVLAILFLCMLLIAIILVSSFNEYMKTNIVNKIHKINELLFSITNGDYNQIVDIRNVYELSELSDHINTMVQGLFSSNSKLTYILSRTNIFLGTYEYSFTSNYVKFSEYIPTLFSWDEETLNMLSSSRDDFKDYIDSIRTNAVPYEQNVYEINDKYIKIDEILENDYILGVAMDVTDNIKKSKKLVREIHLDTLTGLYNHKGIELKLDSLFSSPETLGYYALVILKADGLIKVNSSYGPENGDIYLQKIANIITDFGIKNSVAARQWGGEFILFLYNYDNEKEVTKAIDLLTYIQNHTIAHLDNNIDVPVDFSFAYRISHGFENTDYHALIKEVSDIKNNVN